MALVAAVAVTDAAAQTVTLSVPQGTSLAEGGGSTDVTVTATLSAARTSATTVTLSLAGTATRQTDYAVADPPPITIPAGQTERNATLFISPVDDTVYEGPESILVNGSAGGLTVAGVSVPLTDNDLRPTIEVRTSITSSNTRLDEDEPSETVTVRISATLIGGTRLPEDTAIEIFEGHSSFFGYVPPGIASRFDYTSTPNIAESVRTTFTILAGEVQSESLDVTYTVRDDTRIEPRETLGWFFEARDHLREDLVIREIGPAFSIYIYDNDSPPPIHVRWDLLHVVEGGSVMASNIIVSVPENVAIPLPVSFVYRTSRITLSPSTLTIPAGSRMVTANVTVSAGATEGAGDGRIRWRLRLPDTRPGRKGGRLWCTMHSNPTLLSRSIYVIAYYRPRRIYSG